MSALEIVDSLKWPVIVVIAMFMFMFMRTAERFAQNAERFTERFAQIAEKFVERDTLAIARSHAAAITHGAFDAVDDTGCPGALSYLFWWSTPRRKTVEGIVPIVNAPQAPQN
jgi:hypothetical protein